MDSNSTVPRNIQSLPYDILVTVLEYTTISDIVCFGNTCKQFNELIKNCEGLWKTQLRKTINSTVYKLIENKTDGSWYNEVKMYAKLQADIHAQIIDMAAYFYGCNNDINLFEVKQFLNGSFSNGFTYYCTINILQEMLAKENKSVIIQNTKKPYTLTEMYYSKIVLQHLMQAYLTMKWVQAHVKNDLPPEFVVNYFIQWVDPLKMHTDDKMHEAINGLVSMVEEELKKIRTSKPLLSIKELCVSGEISEEQIVAAISHVMYKVKRMTPVTVANLDTLDIVRVIEMGCGHDVVIATIYHAVAKQFNVRCEVIAFPNHMFLEFRSSQNSTSGKVFKIELDTGKLAPKRACPFTNHDASPNTNKYNPDSLLHFVVSAFLMPMGSYRTWHMQNAFYLLDFLSSNPSSENKYNTYLPYLLDNTHLPVLTTPINVMCLTDEQIKMITLLAYLTKSPPPTRKDAVINKRSSEIKYAVGMVVKHRVYDYLCVIRDWERAGSGPPAKSTRLKRTDPHQPTYIVIAIDQSDRYVAQEHLKEFPRPNRLYHLEDLIAKEFTHFNGFAYEPNAHKQAEYPGDMAVSNQYRLRAINLYGQENEARGSSTGEN